MSAKVLSNIVWKIYENFLVFSFKKVTYFEVTYLKKLCIKYLKSLMCKIPSYYWSYPRCLHAHRLIKQCVRPSVVFADIVWLLPKNGQYRVLVGIAGPEGSFDFDAPILSALLMWQKLAVNIIYYWFSSHVLRTKLTKTDKQTVQRRLRRLSIDRMKRPSRPFLRPHNVFGLFAWLTFAL